MNPKKNEGFVVCDKNWRRMKIKNSEYVRINWLGDLNLSNNKDPKKYIVIEIILAGEGESFSNYCPEWSKIIKDFMRKIEKLNEYIHGIYEENKKLQKKEFAREVEQYPKDIQSMVFGLRGNWKKFEGRVEHILNPKKFYNFIIQYDP